MMRMWLGRTFVVAGLPPFLITNTDHIINLCLSVREYEIIKLLTLSNISILKREDDIFHFFLKITKIFLNIYLSPMFNILQLLNVF